jgi:hypothetical protein
MPERSYQLNVIFHGLWAFHLNANGMTAVTTDHHHHRKTAGEWAAPAFDLQPGEHALQGVRPGSERTFSAHENLMVTTDDGITKSAAPLYFIALPDAREIHSKRKFPAGPEPMFEGADVPSELPAEIAMLQVLVYDFDDPYAVTLSPLAWKPKFNADGWTANLHLFAQPDTPLMDPEHFKHAYRELAAMFALDIQPTRTVRAPLDTRTGIDGFPSIEELGLDERDSGGPQPGVSGANCEMLVVREI